MEVADDFIEIFIVSFDRVFIFFIGFWLSRVVPAHD